MNDHFDTETGKAARCPFTVVVDSREQLPYRFEGICQAGRKIIVPVERGTLVSGDYAIKGLEDRATIERKSVADFYGSITFGRDRLKAEFERMNEMTYSAIVIEGRLDQVLEPGFHGRRIKPQSIRATVASWSVKYATQWFFLPSREQAERMTFELLEKFHRMMRKNENAPDTAISGAKYRKELSS